MSENILATGLHSFTLSDIAHVEMGQSPDSRYVVEDPFQGLAFLQGNAEFGAVYPEPRFGCLRPAKRCKINDVLISVRAPVGAINVADRDYCIGRGLAAIRGQGIKPSLLGEVVARQSTALRRVAQGTTFEAVNKKDLQTLKLLLPPKTQWSQLAEILDALDTAIHETEAIIAKLKAVKQGLLNDLLTRGINANGELRPPQAEAPDLYKESHLGWIPKGWNAHCFGNLADYTNGNTFDAAAWSDTGLPIIRIQNLNGSMEFNYYTGKVQENWRVYPGDLLFAWAGQRGSSFGARIWKGVEGVLNQHIFKVLPREKLVSKDFLFLLFRFRQTVIEEAAHGFKDSFLHVTKGELGEVYGGIPSRGEQDLIEQKVAQFECKLLNEELSLYKLKRLKSGLLDDLLTGRVRVTPLPAEAANNKGAFDGQGT